VPVEAAAFAALYAACEVLRGLVAGQARLAVEHGREVAALERRMHLFLEPTVAHLAAVAPGFLAACAVGYVTLHFAVTALVLSWLHRTRHRLYPLVRTALLLTSGIALIGYLVFPAAPPRLAGLSIPDAVSTRGIELNHGLISALYNPYAALPSLHTAYAAVIGVTVAAGARRRLARALGALYPLLVVVIIVATGNHFLVDAGAGILVAAFSSALAGTARARVLVARTNREAQPPGRSARARARGASPRNPVTCARNPRRQVDIDKRHVRPELRHQAPRVTCRSARPTVSS
jgi:hypothetical protein